ncbi:MAG: PLP-dependent aminotransferase family protein [Pseudomonadota bacterium]
MKQSNYGSALLSLSLDKSNDQPLYAQLMHAIRSLILDRKLIGGERLPASRELAEELGVSRSTITTAYDQLVSEGYLEARQGSGHFVDPNLPDYNVLPSKMEKPTTHARVRAPLPAPFETATPELATFPHRDWSRSLELAWRNPDITVLSRGEPFGWEPLRRAISKHLHDWRGVSCDPSHVIITSGLVESINVISKTILKPGDIVLSEEPGFPPLRNALTANGLDSRYSTVDVAGLDPKLALKRNCDAKAVFVTASRQFPLGMTLPVGRRIELLNWAAAGERYVVEDDFDSEFRYEGSPLPAMHSLDNNGRVIYLGSFSKVMFPSLRIGYMVVPNHLVPSIHTALENSNTQASIISQPALVNFMESGAFATHIRRMRRIYSRRLKAMLSALELHGQDLFRIDQTNSGFHVVAYLRQNLARRMSDVEASNLAMNIGINTKALSDYFARPSKKSGLVLGFAAFDESAIAANIERLCEVLRSR